MVVRHFALQGSKIRDLGRRVGYIVVGAVSNFTSW